jgi:hypothetical protein
VRELKNGVLQMPRRPKPEHLKVISGSRQPSTPSVSLPLVEEVPPAPDWLPNVHAVREWNRLVPLLVANRVLTEPAISALATLCALHGKIIQLWMAGQSPTGFLLSQYRALLGDFGLTPATQGKVHPGTGPSANPFTRNGRPDDDT